MAAPALLLVGQTALGTGVGIGVSAALQPLTANWSSIVSSNLVPADYLRRINAWFSTTQTMQPDPGMIISAAMRGFVPWPEATSRLRYSGIAMSPNHRPEQPMSPENLVNYANRSRLFNDLAKSALSRPDVNFAMQSWARGLIEEADARRLITRAGGDWQDWRGIFNALFTPFDLPSLLAMKNRDYLQGNEWEKGLRHLGYRSDRSRALIEKMREVLPSISDLITFAVRDVWDRQIVDNNRLFDDLPQQFVDMAAKLGYYGNSGVMYTRNGQQVEAKWPEVNWAAHWQPMPLGVAYDAYHRMRPDRIARYQAVGIPAQTFTFDNLKSVIKQADYPPGVRDSLAAMSYQPLMLRQINSAIAANEKLAVDPTYRNVLGLELAQRVEGFNRDWAIGQFRDRALLPDDAAVAADLAILSARDKDALGFKAWEKSQTLGLVKSIISAYKSGIINHDEAERDLVPTSVDMRAANMALAKVDMEIQISIVNATVSKIRSDYLSGITMEAEARGLLATAGIVPARIDTLIAKWFILLDRRRKTANTQQLLKWLEEGLISEPEVRQRLLNLGWDNADQLTLLREAQIRVLKVQTQLISAQEKNRKAAAKELERVAKQAQQTVKQSIADLRQNMPRASILAWVRKGQVSGDWAIARLRAQRWPEESIQNWIREATGLAPVKRVVTSKITTKIAQPGKEQQPPSEEIIDVQIGETRPQKGREPS